MSDNKTHPGDILIQELEERGMTQVELAKLMDVPQNRVSRVCRRMTAVTADTAARLEKVLGIPARLWLALQGQYDMDVAKEKHGKEWEALKPAANG